MSEADRIAGIVKQAAEIAESVPENLQEAAFNRVFEALSQADTARAPAERLSGRAKQSAGKTRTHRLAATDEDPKNVADDLIAALDRTAHPEITGASLVLDRALGLLLVANRDHGIDGMSAAQIAKVLTEKFRLPTKEQAVRKALTKAGGYVDFVPQVSGAAIYRLMDSGEKYLDSGDGKPRNDSGAGPPRRKTGRSPKKARKAKKATKSSSSLGSQDVPSRKRSAGKGPKSMVEALIEEGFFDSPKVISDVQDQLRDKRGAVFKATDLSPVLVRLLRENALDRDRNDSNQFEYKVPS